VYLSNETNLVANPVSNGFHIYLRDAEQGTTKLVDADVGGVGSTDEELAAFDLSPDGRHVAFSSPDGLLVPLDRNWAVDVFVRDMVSGTNELASARGPITPETGDGPSSMSQASVSADGRWVAFTSAADDLAPNDNNHESDVFVWDCVGRTMTLVSAGLDGNPALGGISGSPVITPDGRYVAFVSMATNLVVGPTNSGYLNVFRRDMWTGITRLVSVASDGVNMGNGNAYYPVLSEDGRYVTFQSSAGNLLPMRTIGRGIFWRDMNQATNAGFGFNNNMAYGIDVCPSMSLNGRFVGYMGYGFSTNQVRIMTLFVRDTLLGVDAYTNTAFFSPPTSSIREASLSPDGRHMLYRIPAGLPYANTLALDDVMTGTNILTVISTRPLRSSGQWSADGRYCAFLSSTNTSTGSDDGTNKLYVCDTTTGDLTVVDRELEPAGSLTAFFDSPVMSADGRFVSYRTATNMTNPQINLFLFDQFAGTNAVLASECLASNPPAWVSLPSISGSGATIAVSSTDPAFTHYDPNDLNGVEDVFALTPGIGPVLDSDGDGIPDWWMNEHFGHPTGQESDLTRAQDDYDGDGMSNWGEWLAKTDPADKGSRLILVNPVWTRTGVTITWQSVPGVVYCVERTSGVHVEPFSTIQNNITAQGVTTSFTDPYSTNSAAYLYLVRVQ
jgi:Tol biopolymer transport system component